MYLLSQLLFQGFSGVKATAACAGDTDGMIDDELAVATPEIKEEAPAAPPLRAAGTPRASRSHVVPPPGSRRLSFKDVLEEGAAAFVLQQILGDLPALTLAADPLRLRHAHGSPILSSSM